MGMRKLLLAVLKKMKFLPPAFYVSVYYEYYTGKKIDISNPIEFNQKLQWLKVFYKPSILTQLVDKYEVRSYVEEKVGPQYLNKLIGVYYNSRDVDFEALPAKFVLKGAHGYNFNLLVPDKSKLNKLKAKYLFRKWMSKNHYYRGGLEWAYKNVVPKIVAEEFLEEEGKDSISDYKYFCFAGEPKFIQVDLDRKSGHVRSYVDLEWKKIAFTTIGIEDYKGEVKIPKNSVEMENVARTLAADFPFVRVDLYNLDGRIIFGEMTFYPTDGRMDFAPDNYNTIIGDYLQLPEIPEGQKYIH